MGLILHVRQYHVGTTQFYFRYLQRFVVTSFPHPFFYDKALHEFHDNTERFSTIHKIVNY